MRAFEVASGRLCGKPKRFSDEVSPGGCEVTVGTQSVLFGVHCFLIHPFILLIAWWKLYGFPWDPRLWFAFFLHDIGYLGKPNMDGPEGEQHPYFGAWIMSVLFDWPHALKHGIFWDCIQCRWMGPWGMFTLLHSRYLAKKLGMPLSRLAIADKLVIAIEPSWLYLPRAIASGEIEDYYQQAVKAKPDPADQETCYFLSEIQQGGKRRDALQWHMGMRGYMRVWVDRHRDGAVDTMTSAGRGN